MANDLLTAVSDFIRERKPEAKMLRKQVAELGLPPVTETTEQIREMGYEDLNDFRRARIAQGQLGNSEFEREIRNYMGPQSFTEVANATEKLSRDGASAVDHTRIKTLLNSPNYNYHGIYTRPVPNSYSYEKEIKLRRASEKASGFDKIFQENDMEGGEPDMVYILGIDNANPRTQAHEFLHRTGLEEPDVQLLMAWLSRTPEEWDNAVTRHKNYAESYEGATSSPFSSYEEAEQDLLKKLQEARPEFLAAEVEALEEQHQARLASLDEKGIPYTINEERDREARERNLANRTDMADFRAKGRNKIKTYEISSIPLN